MTQYYIAVNGQSQGPFSLEEIKSRPGLTQETLIWKPGMENWKPLREFEELADIVTGDQQAFNGNGQMWFAMINEVQVGPRSVDELFNEGIDQMTPVWTAGMDNWVPAKDIPDFAKHFMVPPVNFGPANNVEAENLNEGNQFANNPQYDPNHTYNSGRNYRNPYQNQYNQNPYNRNPYNPRDFRPNYGPMHTNWLPWAIGATVVGFFFSCIGAIFGIIGIVQANKANNLYALNEVSAANQANSNARTMTIIGYVFAGIGLLAVIFFGGLSGILGTSYY